MSSFSVAMGWRLIMLLLLTCAGLGDDSSDKDVLVEFKNAVLDPSGLLSTWTESSHHCSWHGIICDENSRVLSLNITGFGSGHGGNFEYSINTTAAEIFSCSDYSLFPFYGFGIRKDCVGINGSLFGKLVPSIGNLSELRILSLPFNRLSGGIPNEIWELEKLQVIDLENNLLSGSWPDRISGLKNLRVLNMGFNNMTGKIPDWLSSLEKLEILNLAFNPLMNGSVPGFIGRLRGVYLSMTWLEGELPADIGKNCKLEHLDLSGNMLTGKIPASLGNCSELRSLLLFSNLLEGEIPHEFGQLQNLQVLDVSRNSLGGPIPIELGDCSGLTVLVLSNYIFNPIDDLVIAKWDPSSLTDDLNFYQGVIPDGITKLPKLRVLWAPRATLVGNLPSDWGACDNLEMVNLAQNFFAGEIPIALSLCKNLRYLDLSSNKRLTGELFEELPVPCLSVFDVSENLLSGSIPEFYSPGCPDVLTSDSYAFEPFNPTSAYLSYFARKTQAGKSFGYFGGDGGPTVFHNFGGNNFTGSVLSMPLAPERLEGQISYAFFAGGNLLSGPFPGSFFEDCNGLSALFVNVSHNRISGQLPAEISLCKSLHFLDVSANQITGPIPASVGDLVSLVALDLSRNLLEDQIPISLGQMKDLTFLSLAGNNLTGFIASSFEQLQTLEILDMSWNSLAGEIPDGLVGLTNLIVLRLNNNKLSGQIPFGLANSPLIYYNVSFNNLSGPLPSRMNLMDCSSLVGNPFLDPCLASADQAIAAQIRNYTASGLGAKGGGRGSEKIFNSTEVALVALVSTIIVVAPALVSCFVYRKKWVSKLKRFGHKEEEITIFTDIGARLTYEGILRATENFSASKCIGNGGFGTTYKAEMSAGCCVAVKKLGFGRLQGFQQFEAEIETLGKLRHPNLVTLIGYYAGEMEETFLVYNYLAGGNLDKFIRERSTRRVDWKILHKIALDVARALAYLHNQCVPRILHRDVKPSNVLLDEEYNAYLSDFGLARFMEESSSSGSSTRSHMTMEVAGTYGYVAPEYAVEGHASEKADVYSYGVLLLELFSDKKAEDPSFADYGYGYDFNIVQWGCLLRQQGKVKEFFAAGLWDSNHQNELEEIFQLALVCTLTDHSLRPKMEQVERRLKQLQPR